MSAGWLGAALKRLRDERLPTLGLAALVLVTAFVFTAAPRVLDAVGDRVLRDEVAGASLLARNVQFVEEDRIRPDGAGDDPLGPVDERGGELTDRLAAPVQGILQDGGWQIESGRHQLADRANPYFVRFRFQQGVDERVRYADGHAPSGATHVIDEVVVNDVEVDDLVAFEVALSRESARVFRVDVGEAVVVYGDETDPLIGRIGDGLQYRAFKLVGTYEVLDPDDPWWLGDRMLVGPVARAIDPNLDVRFLDAAALMAEASYPAFVAATDDAHSPLRYVWRRFVAVDRLESSTLDPIVEGLRRAQTTFSSANPTPTFETGYRTSLLALIESSRARWSAAVAILTVAAVGPAAVATAALALVTVLAAHRRRISVALSRSRGASLTQLVVAVVTEGLLLTIPAAAIATLVAFVLVPDGSTVSTLGAAAGVALLTTAILVATSVPAATTAARPGRDGEIGAVRRAAPRRLVFEGLIVALAFGGAWLLRERGVRGTSTAGTLEAADPLIAAVPALVGLGVGLLAVRLLPLPIRFLAWLAGARRDLVPVLAMRRAASGAGAAPVLVVLLATATIGAFSSAALVHLERGTENTAWQEVGAAYRVDSPAGPLPATLDGDRLPQAEASASVYRAQFVVGLSGPRVEFVVLDTEDYQRAVAGTPADPSLPAELLGPGGSPIPALVSRSLGDRPDGVAPGEVFEVSVEGFTLTYRAAAVRDSFPGIPAGSHFAIVSRAHFNTLAPDARLYPTSVLVRAPDDAADALRTAALDIVAGGTVVSRAERTAALRESPVSAAVRLGVVAAAAIAAAYAALGVASAIALAGLARATEVAHLRTLGLTRLEAFGLVAIEHGPIVAGAFAGGVGLGLALFLLLRPGLGLSTLVGSTIEVPLSVEGGQLAIVLAAIVGIVILALGVGAVLQGVATPAAAIRRGFE